jgi:hypothetical protein
MTADGMRFVPVFEPGEVRFSAGAGYRDEAGMLFGKAVFLGGAGDSATVRVRGRQLGIIFLRHDWSGIVEITVGDERHRLDLFSPTPMTWVFEAPLPATWGGVRVTVRATAERHPSSNANQAFVQAMYVSDYLTSEIPDLLRARVEPTRSRTQR